MKPTLTRRHLKNTIDKWSNDFNEPYYQGYAKELVDTLERASLDNILYIKDQAAAASASALLALAKFCAKANINVRTDDVSIPCCLELAKDKGVLSTTIWCALEISFRSKNKWHKTYIYKNHKKDEDDFHEITKTEFKKLEAKATKKCSEAPSKHICATTQAGAREDFQVIYKTLDGSVAVGYVNAGIDPENYSDAREYAKERYGADNILYILTPDGDFLTV